VQDRNPLEGRTDSVSQLCRGALAVVICPPSPAREHRAYLFARERAGMVSKALVSVNSRVWVKGAFAGTCSKEGSRNGLLQMATQALVQRRVAGGRWQIAAGRWEVESGRWEVVAGGLPAAGCKLRCKSR